MPLLAALLLCIPVQDDLDKVVEKIEKAYAPITSAIVEYETVQTNRSMAAFLGAMKRTYHLRYVRGGYQSTDLFMSLESMGRNVHFSTSVVRIADRICHKSFVFAAGDEEILIAEKVGASDESSGRPSLAAYLTLMTGDDFGLLSTALNPRWLLAMRDSVLTGTRMVEGTEYHTVEYKVNFELAGDKITVTHYFDKKTGRVGFSEMDMSGMFRARLVIEETQEVAGVPIPRKIQLKPIGAGRGFGGSLLANAVNVRVIAANSDKIPKDPPAWIRDPALPERTRGTIEEALQAAEKNPNDPKAQLRALSALGNQGMRAPDSRQQRRKHTPKLLDRLIKCETDSELVHELVGASLLAKGDPDRLDKRVEAAAKAGKRTPFLAFLHLKSLSARNKNQEVLKAFEACQGDPFTRACAAQYELGVRIRVAEDAAAISAIVSQRVKGLDWDGRLAILDRIEGPPAPTVPGLGVQASTVSELSSRAREILDELARTAETPEILILTARAFWKQDGGAAKAAELYLLATENAQAFTAIASEAARFAESHPDDKLIEKLIAAPKLKTVKFLIKQAAAKLKADDKEAALRAVRAATAFLEKGAKIFAGGMQELWGGMNQDRTFPDLLKALFKSEASDEAHRLVIAAAKSDPVLVRSLLEMRPDDELMKALGTPKSKAYELLRALDAQAERGLRRSLQLSREDLLKLIRARLAAGTHDVVDGRQLAALGSHRLPEVEAKEMAELMKSFADQFPREHDLQAGTGDAYRTAAMLPQAIEMYRRAVQTRPDLLAIPEMDPNDPFDGPIRGPGRQPHGEGFRSLPIVTRLADTISAADGKEKAVKETEAWLAESRRDQDLIEGANALAHLERPERALNILMQVLAGPEEDWSKERKVRARTRAFSDILNVADSAKKDYVRLFAAELVLVHADRFQSDPFTGIDPGFHARRIVMEFQSGEALSKLIDAYLKLDHSPLPEDKLEEARKAVAGLSAPFIQDREAATRKLRELGPGTTALLKGLVGSKDAELANRARAVLEPWARETLRKEFFKGIGR
jgi:tetratricopeptide (TPR) repeat protein